MDLLEFIFYIGVINVVFNAIWGFLTRRLLDFTGMERHYWSIGFQLRVLGSYFLVSLWGLFTAAYTLTIDESYSMLYYIVGGAILVSVMASQLQRQRIRHMMMGMQVSRRRMFIEWSFIGLCLVYYVLTLIYTQIVDLVPLHRILEGVQWIYDTPVIGWIVKIVAFFFTLVMVFRGLNLITSALDRMINGRPMNSGNRSDDYTEYEEVVEEDETAFEDLDEEIDKMIDEGMNDVGEDPK